jgi:hypothetical protein
MLITILVFYGFVLFAAADWTTKIYDVIVVGAGPAGIIGMYPAILPPPSNQIALFPSSNITQRMLHANISRLSVMDS